jgi:hypothetical protein
MDRANIERQRNELERLLAEDQKAMAAQRSTFGRLWIGSTSYTDSLWSRIFGISDSAEGVMFVPFARYVCTIYDSNFSGG